MGTAQVARVLYRQLQHPEELRAVPHRQALLIGGEACVCGGGGKNELEARGRSGEMGGEGRIRCMPALLPDSPDPRPTNSPLGHPATVQAASTLPTGAPPPLTPPLPCSPTWHLRPQHTHILPLYAPPSSPTSRSMFPFWSVGRHASTAATSVRLT